MVWATVGSIAAQMLAAGVEPGDQHHCRRAGTVTMHVKSGAVHRNEFVDEAVGRATVVDEAVVVVGSWWCRVVRRLRQSWCG